MDNARLTALNALIEHCKTSSYTNLTIKKYLRNVNDVRDKRFITTLFYGVIENKLLLDHYISKVSSVKLRKINPVVLNILRMGLYQIIFLSTPASAACDTSVKLAKKNGQFKSAGFVNAILRKLSVSYNDITVFQEHVKFSISQKNYEVLVNSLGLENAKDFLLNGKKSKELLYAAVNLKRITVNEIIELFSNLGINAYKTEFDGLISFSDTVDIESSLPFCDGLCHVIGFPSYLSAISVNPANSQNIIDMCAAPGGKTLVMAYNSCKTAEIHAFDLHEHKIKLINDNCKRAKINNVNACVCDGTLLNEKYINTADRVLCDVPCSGLGMIFKKPDIKYKDIDFDLLIKTQYQILSNGAKYLKSGGRLVYSTCTVNINENRGVIDKFLAENPAFSLDSNYEIYNGKKGDATFMPCEKFSDGFYIAVLTKN